MVEDAREGVEELWGKTTESMAETDAEEGGNVFLRKGGIEVERVGEEGDGSGTHAKIIGCVF